MQNVRIFWMKSKKMILLRYADVAKMNATWKCGKTALLPPFDRQQFN